MAITQEETKHVAKLAKLSFKEDELPTFTAQMDKIIEMVELLEQVETTDVPLTVNVVDGVNVLREDVPEQGTPREELMKNVPDETDGFIRVPAILDDGEAGA